MTAAILARAIAAAAIPATIAVLLAPTGPMLAVPAAAAVLAAFACRGRAGRTATWMFGFVLASVSVLAAARARELADAALRFDAWPRIELAREPMPATPPRFVEVTGILRDGFVLAEYDVPQGGIPDQSRPADAVLVPMTGSADPKVELEGAIVVARVRAADQGDATVTVRGRTEPLAPELLRTLVDLSGGDAGEVSGVLVDTLVVPSPREAWLAIVVAALLVLGSAIAYALGRR